MRVINFGSLNIDHVYRVDHIASAGETVACTEFSFHAGGKGANQSIAIARAGGVVSHAGMIGYDGMWMSENMKKDGVDTRNLIVSERPTGHAVIQVDRSGQNSIVTYGGTNMAISKDQIEKVIDSTGMDDLILLQNEISNIGYVMQEAAEKGLPIYFNPAPMGAEVFDYPLETVSTFIINEKEGAALTGAQSENDILEQMVKCYPKAKTVLTLGQRGAIYAEKNIRIAVNGCNVKTVDATGAGDTFIGYMLAGIQKNKSIERCLSFANKAAALSVTRKGAAASIPYYREIE